VGLQRRWRRALSITLLRAGVFVVSLARVPPGALKLRKVMLSARPPTPFQPPTGRGCKRLTRPALSLPLVRRSPTAARRHVGTSAIRVRQPGVVRIPQPPPAAVVGWTGMGGRRRRNACWSFQAPDYIRARPTAMSPRVSKRSSGAGRPPIPPTSPTGRGQQAETTRCKAHPAASP